MPVAHSSGSAKSDYENLDGTFQYDDDDNDDDDNDDDDSEPMEEWTTKKNKKTRLFIFIYLGIFSN